MSKRTIMVASVLVLVFATAFPAYAQTTGSVTNQGFFGEIANFFGNIFHHQSAQNVTMQGQQQAMPMQDVTPGQNAPSGTVNSRPSGQPGYQSMQQYRLSKLVNEGKITQTQEQEILTEL